MSPAQSWPPRLVAITDLERLDRDVLVRRARELARAAQPGGVALLLRDHTASGRQRLALGLALRDAAREHEQQLWVADRIDLALLLDADTLHLGEASVTALQARRLLPARVRVSRAWHRPRLDERGEHELDGVEALLVSPVMAPRKGRPPLGLAALSGLGEQLRARNQAYPLLALGGVTPENAGACLAAGAAGVAAIGAAFEGEPGPLLEALHIAG
jgi:thiamine-phosphate diphosphorylase